MKIGVTSKTLSQMELTTLAQVDDPAAADGGPGVANVAIWGQRDRQFQVLVDPDRLRAHGVTLDDGRAGRAATRVSLAGRRLRRHAEPAARRSRHRVGDRRAARPANDRRRRPRTARRCGSATWPTVVEGLPAADRRRGHQRRPGPAADRREAAGGNTLEVTRDVEAALEALKPGADGRRGRPDDLPPGDVHRAVAATT